MKPCTWLLSTNQQPDKRKVLPCLSIFFECLSFPLFSLFSVSLFFWHSTVNFTWSQPVVLYQMQNDEWKEDLTWPSRGYHIPGKAIGPQASSYHGWLASPECFPWLLVLNPEKPSNSYTSPAFHSSILSSFHVHIYYQAGNQSLFLQSWTERWVRELSFSCC